VVPKINAIKEKSKRPENRDREVTLHYDAEA
jgi:hypothetical protein